MTRWERRRRRNTDIFFINKVITYGFFGLIGSIVFVFVLSLWYSKDLPTPGKLSASNLSESTKILDRNGIVLYDVYKEQNRTYVPLLEIPKTLQQATIAIENRDFYSNQGFSIWGYLRAIKDILLFKGLSGGSTLTQQLVKNALLTSERTIPRKIKEFILSIEVEKKYSKDQILELYLNVAPYGGTAVGVEAASERYFGKKVKELNLIESAILAGLPQRPSYYNPNGEHPKAYILRTKDVLRRMREDEYISPKQEQEALKALPALKFQSNDAIIKAPHFSFFVKNILIKQFGEKAVESGGLQITTTLDFKLQAEAEKIVKEEVETARYLEVGNGASVVLDPTTGEVLAMVGSKDFFATGSAKTGDEGFEGQFNVVTEALRQPGSSIKPVTYATALEKGYTASTLLMDTKTVFPNPGQEKDYEPQNYDGKYHGPVQMRFALGSSLNIPAVKMLALIGVKNMLTTSNNLGLVTLAPTDENIKRFGLSITLGGGEVRLIEMAGAYSAFSNGGYKVDPITILKVTDRKGKVLYEHKKTALKQVLSPEVAFIISHILSDNSARLLTFGESSYLNIRGKTIAVKTGTTDDKRDNWTIGWTPSVLVATWVGNNDNSPMGNVASGVTGAAPIWRRIILEALKTRPSGDFNQPENVEAVTIDAYSGGLPIDGKPTRIEYFVKGTQPQGQSSIYKELKISKADSKKLASDSEVAKNEFETKKYTVLREDDPVSGDGKNRWQEGIDAWINENYKDNEEYHPPTEKSNREIKDTPTPLPTPIVTPTPTPSH